MLYHLDAIASDLSCTGTCGCRDGSSLRSLSFIISEECSNSARLSLMLSQQRFVFHSICDMLNDECELTTTTTAALAHSFGNKYFSFERSKLTTIIWSLLFNRTVHNNILKLFSLNDAVGRNVPIYPSTHLPTTQHSTFRSLLLRKPKYCFHSNLEFHEDYY